MDELRAPETLCHRCHILDGRKTGRPVTAGCVHEHLSTLVLCAGHERAYQAAGRALWCNECDEAGHPGVPVTILTAPVAPVTA